MNAASSNAALDRLWAQANRPILDAMDRLAVEIAKREYPTAGETPYVENALDDLRRAILGLVLISDLIGRRSALRAADAFGKVTPRRFVAPWEGGSALLPDVAFREMVDDLLLREPRLVESAEKVAELYGKEHAFAVARSAEIETTQRIQKVIATAIKQGVTDQEAVRRILGSAKAIASNADDWTRAYAETVFRTNAATAASAGRFAQVADPDVAAVIGGFRYTSSSDTRVRPNHAALDGLIAAPDDPIWHQCAPPNGWGCRCSLDFMSWGMLEQAGKVNRNGTVKKAAMPRGGGPDPGFKHAGRPDIGIYLGMI